MMNNAKGGVSGRRECTANVASQPDLGAGLPLLVLPPVVPHHLLREHWDVDPCVGLARQKERVGGVPVAGERRVTGG